MQKEPPVEYPAPRDARSQMTTWRILFLDSAENIEQLKGAGKDAGYTVVGALTLAQAWAFLDGKDHADVIVCAAHLEEESMFEFLKDVRESELHRNTKVLILSLAPSAVGARLDSSTASAAMALGADGYAIMPVFDPRELIALIKSCSRPSRCSNNRPPTRRSVGRSNLGRPRMQCMASVMLRKYVRPLRQPFE